MKLKLHGYKSKSGKICWQTSHIWKRTHERSRLTRQYCGSCPFMMILLTQLSEISREDKPSIFSPAYSVPPYPHAISRLREGELNFNFLHFIWRNLKFRWPQRLLVSAQVDREARFTVPPENEPKEQKYGAMVHTVDTKEQTAPLGQETSQESLWLSQYNTLRVLRMQYRGRSSGRGWGLPGWGRI